MGDACFSILRCISSNKSLQIYTFFQTHVFFLSFLVVTDTDNHSVEQLEDAPH